MESWSGRSSSTSPPSRPGVARATWWRCGTCSQASTSSASPQAAAVVEDVVGRRTPTWLSVEPASALNNEDLPEPVAPASATTVWSPASASRPSARSSTAPARASRSGSSRPSVASTASRSAVSRAGRSGPRPVSRFTPAARLTRVSGPARPAARRPHRVQPLSRSSASTPSPTSTSSQRASSTSYAARDPLLEVAARQLGEPPHGLVAEDRLEQLLPQHGAAAGDPDLGAGHAGGADEDHDHEGDGEAVDAEGEEASGGALRLALLAHQLDHGLLPVAHHPLGGGAELARGPPQVAPSGRGQHLPPGRRGAPGVVGTLGGGLGVLDQQRLEAGLHRRGDPVDLRRLAPEEAGDPVTQPADLRLHRAHQVAGADELLPPCQQLPAQQAAVGRGLADLAPGPVVGVVDVVAQLLQRRLLVAVGRGDAARAAHDRLDGPLERLAHDGGARVGVGGQLVEPPGDRRGLVASGSRPWSSSRPRPR